MNKIGIYTIFFVASMGLVACGTSDKKESIDQELPSWILNPVVENGISASDCTPWSGDMGADKAQVTALARAALVKQVKIRVKAMDKTYNRKIKTATGNTAGGTFESVSKQVADESLQGSQVIKIDRVVIDNIKNLCAQVAIDPNVTKNLFNTLITSSGKNLDPQSESVLYEEFKSYKAQEELEKLTNN